MPDPSEAKARIICGRVRHRWSHAPSRSSLKKHFRESFPRIL